MEIKRDIRSPNHSARTQTIDTIVLHATVGDLRPSINELTADNRPLAQRVSAHYIIDRDGTIYELVPPDRVAWHAGVSTFGGRANVNEFSIGIELVNRNDGRDPYPDAQIIATAELVADLMRRYNIPQSRIVSHADVAVPRGRKTDPRGFPWIRFFRLVVERSDIWSTWGSAYPLDAAARSFGIPRIWYRAAASGVPLGAASSPALYISEMTKGLHRLVVQTFERGFVWYDSDTGNGGAVYYERD